MAFEQITGRRTIMAGARVAGNFSAASGTEQANSTVLMDAVPFTITGVAVHGASAMAGTDMAVKVYVNGAAKGIASGSLTPGAGAHVAVMTAKSTITGPANAFVTVAVHTVGATAGGGGLFQYRYHHGWSR